MAERRIEGDPSHEEKKLDLNELFRRRREILKNLDTELNGVIERLLALVPKDLEDFKVEGLHTLGHLLNNIENNGSQENLIQHDDLPNYGFASMKDARQKLKLLQSAWRGIIDVQLEDDEGRVLIVYKLPVNK